MPLPTKSLTIPVDGSPNSLRSIDYITLMFGPEHDLKVLLCYILPSLPLIFENEPALTREERARIRSLELKNIQFAEEILAQAKSRMIEKGFSENRIETAYKKKAVTITKDVCNYAESTKADAILLTRRGKTDVRDLFMGEVCRNLVEYCQELPIWIVSGSVRSKKVLVAVDSSENALRAVDHAAFMISGTGAEVTLFHTLRNIGGYFPGEMTKEDSDMEEAWRRKAGAEITPYLEKSRERMIRSGLDEKKVSIKVVKGTRSPDKDIMKEAREGEYGTIVLGRRGISMLKELFLGSVTNKVLQQSEGFAVWVVQ